MKVLNRRHLAAVPPGAVYVGRPSPWGNPFMIGRDGSRAQVIERYRAWLAERARTDPKFRASLEVLRGKDLVCWCAPLACHADVLLEWLQQNPAPR